MPASLEDSGHDDLRCFVRTRLGPAAMIRQVRGPALLVAVDPLVGGFAADVETAGELRHRLQAAVIIGDELRSLVHE
jgi:hypothetical protein